MILAVLSSGEFERSMIDGVEQFRDVACFNATGSEGPLSCNLALRTSSRQYQAVPMRLQPKRSRLRRPAGLCVIFECQGLIIRSNNSDDPQLNIDFAETMCGVTIEFAVTLESLAVVK